MISFLKKLFPAQRAVPVVFPGVQSPDFQLLPGESPREYVLYDDGWVRVTPVWVQIGDEKKIAVSHIRELRRGLIRDDPLSGLVHNLSFYFFVWGATFCGLLEKWFYFVACLAGLVFMFWYRRRWPYYVSIHASGLLREYLSFSDPKRMEACGRAVEEAARTGR